MTKTIQSWFLMVILPIVAFMVPELVSVDAFVAGTFNLVGVSLLINTFTELFKKIIGYDPETGKKWVPRVFAVVFGAALGILLFYVKMGMFAEILYWYAAGGTGVIAGGLANGWYNYDFAKALIKALFKIDLPEIPASV